MSSQLNSLIFSVNNLALWGLALSRRNKTFFLCTKAGRFFVSSEISLSCLAENAAVTVWLSYKNSWWILPDPSHQTHNWFFSDKVLFLVRVLLIYPCLSRNTISIFHFPLRYDRKTDIDTIERIKICIHVILVLTVFFGQLMKNPFPKFWHFTNSVQMIIKSLVRWIFFSAISYIPVLSGGTLQPNSLAINYRIQLADQNEANPPHCRHFFLMFQTTFALFLN